MENFFSKRIQVGNKIIGNGLPALFIADVGANFDGDIEKAKKLALACRDAGADVFKIQSFLSPKIVSGKGFSSMQLKGVHGSWSKPVDEVFKDAEFPREWHQEMVEYCKEIGILFSSSPYDYEAVDLLDTLGVPFFKIGSGDITWHDMLKYIAKKGKPVILATGASTLAEVDEAVRIIKECGNKNLILLQCITNYPSKPESANINVLKTYQTAFDTLVGYSDHTPGDTIILGSIALGGVVVEKHFTLDKTGEGPDHQHSMEPNEFKEMVTKTRILEAALGTTVKGLVEEESETVIVQRRGLYANRDIMAGEVLVADDIVELRPALGILPQDKGKIVGSPTQRNISAGAPIYWDDLHIN